MPPLYESGYSDISTNVNYQGLSLALRYTYGCQDVCEVFAKGGAEDR